MPKESFGKDVANQGLYRALAEHGKFSQLHWLTAQPASTQQLRDAFLPRGGATALRATDLLDLYAPCLSGTLLRGQPYLAELAWIRGAFRRPSAYSLVGLIHT
ncbi:MAG: glycosyl transferase family 1, partial [Synechococcaceae bacterium WB9_2_170]|nr:glycosyl transferase family 1 [Synechococcaceae bacterium WB9_2_170]